MERQGGNMRERMGFVLNVCLGLGLTEFFSFFSFHTTILHVFSSPFSPTY